MATTSPTTLLLRDIIQSPLKAESILESLTAEQIIMIESTIDRVKRRKMDRAHPKEEKNTNNASAIANALAAAMVSAALQSKANSLVSSTNNSTQTTSDITTPTTTTTNDNNGSISTKITTTTNNNNNNDPVAEIKNGIEWVSFVYSHNRTLKRYSIRTDIQNVQLNEVDEKFKAENCVYPRANLPKETYKGNRWAYETECNDLGWKLAWLNKEEIAGKRGLIQRAVDSYRNRYPSMRSRRVARQEKLLNGTLRKRKNREEDEENQSVHSTTTAMTFSTIRPPQNLEAAIVKSSHQPKTIAIDDVMNHARYRIKIGIETISLDEIPVEFRIQNCPFPRAIHADPDLYIGGRQRWVQDNILNELSWRLAYLNPKILVGKKNLLQRALDVYRSKFMPSLQPRRQSCRSAPSFDKSESVEKKMNKKNKKNKNSTVLEFSDCFSLDDEAASNSKMGLTNLSRQVDQDPMISPSYDDTMCVDTHFSPFDESCNTSSSSSSSVACTPSPPVTADIFGFADVFDSFMLPPVNDTFLLLDNDTNMGIRCYDSFMSPTSSPESEKEDLPTTSHLLDPLF
ncbi:hypothetical protein G6F57_004010 [Rhizopus arrhizus]|uniref:DUF8032 domain-containing protein n=1 Tax=Rhizopus oryzae TaxID=64495 RepID=A0A9P7BWV8_RHIOR|nr:hypothetical protein G6F23_006382 [Rhizopus arrhizus]KAG1399350.1 hypothetical protein G6F58_011150 [Rhizopus delemar]KAG0766340.1 hypothetical protein G6F24_003684 [Rhizopus arrhizus]KAG0779464.1 hypothetical protein G6F22_010621 [Rhizopus arrhizus]KAG0796673.1 hypothetical protein G6F21_001126 [Rhizopus arrhizus]